MRFEILDSEIVELRQAMLFFLFNMALYYIVSTYVFFCSSKILWLWWCSCVSVHVEISALCRVRCQTKQHGLCVVISDGGLLTQRSSRTRQSECNQLASAPFANPSFCSPWTLPGGTVLWNESFILWFLSERSIQSALDLSPLQHGGNKWYITVAEDISSFTTVLLGSHFALYTYSKHMLRWLLRQNTEKPSEIV